MKQLPPDTVRLLSSSQVITSIGNVVKELMENSLDAGASSIDVKLENFGLDRIEVRDNGDGVKAADAPVMAVRHFTSKISGHEDLERLETYGFRGEALGSICAVAEVTVTTKTEEEDISTQYTLDLTGAVVSRKPSHLGQGTTVSVAKLFKNVPVRRQFFSSTKRRKEELRKVQDLLMAYAVLKPELRLTLAHNKVVVWQKAKMADVRSGLLAVLGSGCVAHLLPCHQRQDQPEIVLDGFFPKPGADPSSTSSSTPEKTFIFINNRPVQHKEIMKLLRHRYSAQYSDDAARHRYPIVLLKVAVPPSSVDVNLTPDKTQVLLHNKEAVLTAVEALLVSLYGFRSPAEEGTFLSPSSPLQAESTGSADVSNCSSSSSVADDWIVSRGPAELQPDHETTAETSPGRLEDANVSAEDWSRGTALTDPVSGEPLRPVVIQSGSGEARSPAKKTLNAVTEKRAALTVYDMISNRAARAPLSPAALFEKEARAEVLRERPAAGLRDVSAAVQERWKNLPEEDRKKYEEKAKRSVEHYDRRTKLASAEPAERTPRPKPPAQKRKAPLSNQQLLDELFSARPQKKTKTPAPPKPSRPLPCSVAALRLRLRRLSAQSGAAPRGLRLVNRLASQSAWVAVCGRRLMVLNSFRVEEALLFQRLLENHVLPAVSLQKPLQVTAGSLGGAEYVETLCSMEKRPADLSGGVVFSDPRLVANGFRIQLAADRHLEVTAMADCVPFLGVEDLKEILTAVLHRKASGVRECRPLKVTNYLQAEAVRLARQLPANASRDDVEETVRRMERQLGETGRTCVHGRPFLHHLTDVPSSDEEAKALLRPLEL